MWIESFIVGVSWIGSIIGAALIIGLILILYMEHRHTKRWPTKNDYAYGDRTCECKFISGNK